MIASAANDDPAFVEIADSILLGVTELYPGGEIFVIQIDSWFDHKWLGFSGKALGAVAVWTKQLVIPPFSFNRVNSQTRFTRTSTGMLPSSGDLLYSGKRKPSSDNLNEKFSSAFDSALLFWYSGSTSIHDQGSIMVYHTDKGEEFAWYVSYRKNEEGWLENMRKRISQSELRAIREISARVHSAK